MSKTAQDLRADLSKAHDQIIKVNNQINDRLQKLCKAHPDASVSISTKGVIKASSITVMWEIIKDYDTDTKLNYIQSIEDWIVEQNKYVQTKMF